MVGDFVWFNGKKVVVDKLNDSKIWLRDNGRRLDPVVLAKALESGSLSRTKPERKSEDEPVFEVTESKYEQHYIAFEAADDRNQTYEVTTSEVINPEPKPEPIVNNSEPIVFVEPPEGWSTVRGRQMQIRLYQLERSMRMQFMVFVLFQDCETAGLI